MRSRRVAIRLNVEYPERRPTALREVAEQVALPAREAGGIDDHWPARVQQAFRQPGQMFIGTARGMLRIQPLFHSTSAARQRIQANQTFALDIGTQADHALFLQQRLGERGLAGAGQAVRNPELRRRDYGQAFGELQAGGYFGTVCFGMVARRLSGSQRRHLGAHQGAVHRVIAQARCPHNRR